MNKPGLEFHDPEEAAKTAQFYEVSAAFELRKAALHWEETTLAAWIDAEAAGWTAEAAETFFARAHHPYFVEDAAKSAAKQRAMAERALRSSDTSKPVDLNGSHFPEPDKDGIYKDAHDRFGTRRGVVFEDAPGLPAETLSEEDLAGIRATFLRAPGKDQDHGQITD